MTDEEEINRIIDQGISAPDQLYHYNQEGEVIVPRSTATRRERKQQKPIKKCAYSLSPLSVWRNNALQVMDADAEKRRISVIPLPAEVLSTNEKKENKEVTKDTVKVSPVAQKKRIQRRGINEDQRGDERHS